MDLRPLSIEGAYLMAPKRHGDSRGYFLEWFKEDVFAATVGHGLHLAQANCSVSARGSMRGIHFADVPPSQAKYVTCVTGAVLDVAVDIRVGSPTFGQWEAVRLDPDNRCALYLSEGLGHVFLALEDQSTVLYLCSTPYAPDREHGINPLDPEIGIVWPSNIEPLLSPKDAQAPTLSEAAAAGLLPSYEACVEYHSTLQ
ncbi:MAG: dTDP-4-dehydrorhamnose 3,5-epimerase [Candidatus Nanopelagicales bacterium]